MIHLKNQGMDGLAEGNDNLSEIKKKRVQTRVFTEDLTHQQQNPVL